MNTTVRLVIELIDLWEEGACGPYWSSGSKYIAFLSKTRYIMTCYHYEIECNSFNLNS